MAGWFGGDGEDGGADVGGLFEGVVMPGSDGICPALWEGASTLGLGFCDRGADGGAGGSCGASQTVRSPILISPLHT